MRERGGGRGASVVAATLVLLQACGGESGGPLEVSIDPDQRLVAAAVAPDPAPTEDITGSFGGNRERYWGRTFWFHLSDPGDLVQGIHPSVHDFRWDVSVVWNELPPGHYVGEKVLRITTDEAGEHQVRGSPFTIPYDITVGVLPQVDRTPLSVTEVFGGPRQAATTQASLTSITTSWRASLVIATDPTWGYPPIECGYDPRAGVYNPAPPYGTVPVLTCGADGSVSVSFLPEPPGTYLGTLHLELHAELGGRDYRVDRDIALTHTVLEDPDLVAYFYPPGTEVGAVAGSEDLLWTSPYRLLLGAGATCDRSRVQVEYLSHPAAADGNPFVDRWWNDSPVWVAQPYGLPAGTYTARVHHPVAVGAGEVPFYYPVTMELTPP